MPLSEEEIRQALMQAGTLLPMTETAVAALDRVNPIATLPLPPSLSCETIFDRIQGKKPPAVIRKALNLPTTSAAEGLARAARNGDELPEEVLTRMNADRERIEGNHE